MQLQGMFPFPAHAGFVPQSCPQHSRLWIREQNPRIPEAGKALQGHRFQAVLDPHLDSFQIQEFLGIPPGIKTPTPPGQPFPTLSRRKFLLRPSPPSQWQEGLGYSQASSWGILFLQIPKGTKPGSARLSFPFPFPEPEAGEHRGPVGYPGETGTLIQLWGILDSSRAIPKSPNPAALRTSSRKVGILGWGNLEFWDVLAGHRDSSAVPMLPDGTQQLFPGIGNSAPHCESPVPAAEPALCLRLSCLYPKLSSLCPKIFSVSQNSCVYPKISCL